MPDSFDPSVLQAWHQRLLQGDRLASEELLRALLPLLQSEIARKFPRTDDHLVSDGIIDAMLDYFERTQQYDPGTGVPLDRFLALAAWRNVDNLLRGEHRRKERERKVGRRRREADVALDPLAGNIRQEELTQFNVRKAAMLNALDDSRDKQILALRLEGVRETAAFARILAITHLSLKEQREEVKRHKDRITRFLRRKGLLP